MTAHDAVARTEMDYPYGALMATVYLTLLCVYAVLVVMTGFFVIPSATVDTATPDGMFARILDVSIFVIDVVFFASAFIMLSRYARGSAMLRFIVTAIAALLVLLIVLYIVVLSVGVASAEAPAADGWVVVYAVTLIVKSIVIIALAVVMNTTPTGTRRTARVSPPRGAAAAPAAIKGRRGSGDVVVDVRDAGREPLDAGGARVPPPSAAAPPYTTHAHRVPMSMSNTYASKFAIGRPVTLRAGR